jgi:hypothetical protein
MTTSAISTGFDSIQTSLLNMQANFSQNGEYMNHVFSDIFSKGALVDFRTIGVLNESIVSTAALQTIMENHMYAMVVNWAWHASRTWIFSYPMTQEDFDSRYSNAGTNDFRLKHYYNGRGYFFQRVEATTDGAYVVPVVQDPPGWGDLKQGGSGKIPFSTWDVIESSADGFDIGGYGYNPVDSLTTNGPLASIDLLTDSTRTPGVFNIPICPMELSPYGVHDLDTFFGVLTEGGQYWAPGPAQNDQYHSPYVDNPFPQPFPFMLCPRLNG